MPFGEDGGGGASSGGYNVFQLNVVLCNEIGGVNHADVVVVDSGSEISFFQSGGDGENRGEDGFDGVTGVILVVFWWWMRQ